MCDSFFTDNCPKYTINGFIKDENDPYGISMRVNFTLHPAEVFAGQLISQKVDLEHLWKGSVDVAQCDNCEWTKLENETQIDFSPRPIGPLHGNVTYIPIITVGSEFKIDSEIYDNKGLIYHTCRGTPFVTSYWVCADGIQTIPWSSVCNDPLKPDCKDGSDEDDIRCKGGNKHEVPQYSIASFYICGCLLVFPSKF